MLAGCACYSNSNYTQTLSGAVFLFAQTLSGFANLKGLAFFQFTFGEFASSVRGNEFNHNSNISSIPMGRQHSNSPILHHSIPPVSLILHHLLITVDNGKTSHGKGFNIIGTRINNNLSKFIYPFSYFSYEPLTMRYSSSN
jgi:hypothetical protein